ncbi:hypothetical protein D9M71_812470 [compost metagenome]
MKCNSWSRPDLSPTVTKSLFLLTNTTDFFFAFSSSITLLSVPVLLQSQTIRPKSLFLAISTSFAVKKARDLALAFDWT